MKIEHLLHFYLLIFNTDENFYKFLLAQQDNQTAPVPKRISFYHIFEK